MWFWSPSICPHLFQQTGEDVVVLVVPPMTTPVFTQLHLKLIRLNICRYRGHKGTKKGHQNPEITAQCTTLVFAKCIIQCGYSPQHFYRLGCLAETGSTAPAAGFQDKAKVFIPSRCHHHLHQCHPTHPAYLALLLSISAMPLTVLVLFDKTE